MNKKKTIIAILGDGAWGTTLGILLAEKGHSVIIWGAFSDYVTEMAISRENRKFLPGIQIPSSVEFSADLHHVVHVADMVVLAVPSQYLQGILKKIKKICDSKKPFVSVVKGIDPRTFMTMSEIIHKELGPVPLTVLSSIRPIGMPPSSCPTSPWKGNPLRAEPPVRRSARCWAPVRESTGGATSRSSLR